MILALAVKAITRFAKTWNIEAFPLNTVEVHHDPIVGYVVSFVWHGVLR